MTSEHRFILRELHLALKSSPQSPSSQSEPRKHTEHTSQGCACHGLPRGLFCILARCAPEELEVQMHCH